MERCAGHTQGCRKAGERGGWSDTRRRLAAAPLAARQPARLSVAGLARPGRHHRPCENALSGAQGQGEGLAFCRPARLLCPRRSRCREDEGRARRLQLPAPLQRAGAGDRLCCGQRGQDSRVAAPRSRTAKALAAPHPGGPARAPLRAQPGSARRRGGAAAGLGTAKGAAATQLCLCSRDGGSWHLVGAGRARARGAGGAAAGRGGAAGAGLAAGPGAPGLQRGFALRHHGPRLHAAQRAAGAVRASRAARPGLPLQPVRTPGTGGAGPSAGAARPRGARALLALTSPLRPLQPAGLPPHVLEQHAAGPGRNKTASPL